MSAILIIGESGSGKSTSMRNLDPKKTMLVQIIKKDLPFRGKGWSPMAKSEDEKRTGNIVVTRKASQIIKSISNAKALGFDTVVIDDLQYLMSYELFDRVHETGFKKFTEMALGLKDVLDVGREAEGVNVYFLTHTDASSDTIKMKTIGKMIDEKLTPEGLFAIVLRAIAKDGEHFFTTKNASDTVKTPMGMFEDDLIPNDLAEVDKVIREYYK